MATPYYDDGQIVVYHGDSREIDVWRHADILITDPPYGVAWEGGRGKTKMEGKTVVGDEDTSVRDTILDGWEKPALVFGSWRIPRPNLPIRNILIWDKDWVGAYSATLPWRWTTEEVYVIGEGYIGPKRANVLKTGALTPVDPMRLSHPTPKPVPLLEELIECVPPDWVIADPFAGTGSTLRAAKNLGRQAIGVEIVEEYCATIANVCGQENLFAL